MSICSSTSYFSFVISFFDADSKIFLNSFNFKNNSSILSFSRNLFSAFNSFFRFSREFILSVFIKN